ncbi:MAG: chemotaxis response regulator protein-glutamate methylesterase [Synergistaceae bacterium]|jgi:two-component system chemotaxis response regulator CheB|nr:chemotaxis response regulator protein-glutamate methylesterase [Synergistaceae bacterium]
MAGRAMNAERKIRVLIVDDSAFMRKVIGDILGADPSIDVVGRARNGREAMDAINGLSPDVVTLDIEMPGKSGLEVLRDIMAIKPIPVVMVSSLTKQGANETMQALDSGAVDFVTKPSGTISLDMDKVGDELRQKVIAASKASLRTSRLHIGLATKILPPPPIQSRREAMPRRLEMLVIAASTGGPMALQEVIPELSADFPLPVLIVQHMPPGFTSSFASRLNERSKLTVLEACDGMPIRKGAVIIAPGGYHLIVEKKQMNLVCRLTETPPVRSVRPSADVLFTSVSEVVGGNILTLVLTGMGRDGLDGTRLLRQKGAYVIAESKETSVIYGMPGAVTGAGLVDEVLPLYSIAAGLERVSKQN